MYSNPEGVLVNSFWGKGMRSQEPGGICNAIQVVKINFGVLQSNSFAIKSYKSVLLQIKDIGTNIISSSIGGAAHEDCSDTLTGGLATVTLVKLSATASRLVAIMFSAQTQRIIQLSANRGGSN